MKPTKQALRTEYKAIRAALKEERRKEAEAALVEKFSNSPPFLSFWSFGTEINLAPLNLSLAKKGQLFLPRVEENGLNVYHVKQTTSLVASSIGILEPDPVLCRRINLNELAFLLVPGLAFDRNNFRLGYGKGFYDRLLSDLPLLYSIGIGFQEQFYPLSLPQEAHDVPLKQVLFF